MDMMRPTAAIPSSPPKAPSNLRANLITASSVRLDWMDNTVSETNYTIQRARDANFTIGLMSITVAENRVTITDPTITPGQTYYYRVKAVNIIGDTWVYAAPAVGFPHVTLESAYSNTAQVGRATQTIWTTNTTYRRGQNQLVYSRVRNPGPALPARTNISLQLPSGALYGPLQNTVGTIPANYDSGDFLWRTFAIPNNSAYGNYRWIAELRNPTTNALISRSTWDWQLVP
jgi:hypothetical protein